MILEKKRNVVLFWVSGILILILEVATGVKGFLGGGFLEDAALIFLLLGLATYTYFRIKKKKEKEKNAAT